MPSINVGCSNSFYSELNVLFTYNTIFIEIYPNLILTILAAYKANKYWTNIYCQVQANENLDNDKALFPFLLSWFYILDVNSYMLLCFKDFIDFLPKFKEVILYQESSPKMLENSKLAFSNKIMLLYHVNKITGNL